jgi:hypothetical protein
MTMADEALGVAGVDRVAEPDALVSRLRLIEDQPLDSRAAAFAQLHDELQRRLEGGDSHA